MITIVLLITVKGCSHGMITTVILITVKSCSHGMITIVILITVKGCSYDYDCESHLLLRAVYMI